MKLKRIRNPQCRIQHKENLKRKHWMILCHPVVNKYMEVYLRKNIMYHQIEIQRMTSVNLHDVASKIEWEARRLFQKDDESRTMMRGCFFDVSDRSDEPMWTQREIYTRFGQSDVARSQNELISRSRLLCQRDFGTDPRIWWVLPWRGESDREGPTFVLDIMKLDWLKDASTADTSWKASSRTFWMMSCTTRSWNRQDGRRKSTLDDSVSERFHHGMKEEDLMHEAMNADEKRQEHAVPKIFTGHETDDTGRGDAQSDFRLKDWLQRVRTRTEEWDVRSRYYDTDGNVLVSNELSYSESLHFGKWIYVDMEYDSTRSKSRRAWMTRIRICWFWVPWTLSRLQHVKSWQNYWSMTSVTWSLHAVGQNCKSIKMDALSLIVPWRRRRSRSCWDWVSSSRFRLVVRWMWNSRESENRYCFDGHDHTSCWSTERNLMKSFFHGWR